MVTDHVEFGPLAEEVLLLLLLGPPSSVWKNMTCFLNHWNSVHVCVCVCVCVLVVTLTSTNFSFMCFTKNIKYSMK